ncbi:uncharacterized protein LOC128224766 isoform X1 [Mya arenaria]|nr:uncharacterized protein LOC128224766 isoform X1 [Mya arenaria]XP_052790751.1 uncharacterized protein LOC128224766 isoform X1 [Mya arenaria]
MLGASLKVLVLVAVLISVTGGLSSRGSSGGGHVYDDSPQARGLFKDADTDNNEYLTYGEFFNIFRRFDNNSDGEVTSVEFLNEWLNERIGTPEQAMYLFTIIDLNKNLVLHISEEVPSLFVWFDFNSDMMITDGEFVVQWVKIST